MESSAGVCYSATLLVLRGNNCPVVDMLVVRLLWLSAHPASTSPSHSCFLPGNTVKILSLRHSNNTACSLQQSNSNNRVTTVNSDYSVMSSQLSLQQWRNSCEAKPQGTMSVRALGWALGWWWWCSWWWCCCSQSLSNYINDELSDTSLLVLSSWCGVVWWAYVVLWLSSNPDQAGQTWLKWLM